MGANRSRRAFVQRKLILRDIPRKGLPPPMLFRSLRVSQLPAYLLKALLPSPKTYAKHILLTVSGGGRALDNVSGSQLVPPAIGCVFSSSRFIPPRPVPSSEHTDHEEEIILYGLNEWDGRFSSSCFSSPVQFHSLAS